MRAIGETLAGFTVNIDEIAVLLGNTIYGRKTQPHKDHHTGHSSPLQRQPTR